MESRQFTLLDYAKVVWRNLWLVLALVAVTGVISYVMAARQPKVYRATATILAPKEASPQSMANSLGSLIGGGGKDGGGISFQGISIGGTQSSNSLDLFTALLRSRTLREEVMRDFAKTWGAGVGGMVLAVEPSQAKDRTTMSLAVEATNPQLAADLANGYFDFLDRRLQLQAERDARRQEQLYRAQMDRAAKEVDNAEHALMQFQAENRLLAIDNTSKAGAEGAGSLRGAIQALEMQREIMRMRYTEQHPQMREMDKQISEMKRQYSKNLFGSAMDLPAEGPNKGPRKEYFVSAEKMTPTQFAYLKLLRNLKMQEAFYTGALQGLEQIRYSNDTGRPSGIEPLDPALVPGGPIRPNVRNSVLAASTVAFVAGVVLVLLAEYVRLTWGLSMTMRRQSMNGAARLPVDASRTPANGGAAHPSTPRATV
jgi:uncharacterized protein involved in exopolysaccharide biosynthesis